MKKTIYIGMVCLAAGVLSSCESMLDENPYGKPTAEEILSSSEENMAKIVGQAYAEITWLHDHWGYWGLSTLSSDECVCPIRNPGDDWNDVGYWKSFNTQSWDANGKGFENMWQYSSAGAVLCNKIMGQIAPYRDAVGEKVYNRYVAELKVVRSYYYYTLFDCFGRIPYMEDYASENVPQSDTWEVWNKLVTTLEENAPLLPQADVPSKAVNYGRATQGMAYALLARLYLNAESFGVTPANCGIEGITSTADFYNKCVEACDKIIDSGVYWIEDDFFTNFKVQNEGSNENIFVIVENGNPNFNFREVAGSFMNKLRITLLTLNYAHQQAWGLIEKPWNGFCAPKSFIDLYEYGVDRRGPCDSIQGTKDTRQWGWFLGPVYDAAGNQLVMEDKENLPACITSVVTSLDNATPNDGARLLKYEVEKNSTINKYCENDFVLFRYADVLYMKAEAALRGATNANISDILADSDFQKIRTRAGVEPYTTLDLDELLDERGREFAWEGVRRRDLIRYDRFSQGTWDFKPVVDKHFDWFPIPRKMLETSGGLWTQNEGYTN